MRAAFKGALIGGAKMARGAKTVKRLAFLPFLSPLAIFASFSPLATRPDFKNVCPDIRLCATNGGGLYLIQGALVIEEVV